MAPRKGTRSKRKFFRRNKSVPNPSCDTKSSNSENLENPQNLSARENSGKVRIKAGSSYKSDLKKVRNPENQAVLKNRENVWRNNYEGQLRNTASFSRNVFDGVPSLNRVKNTNNWRSTWINNSNAKQKQRLENQTVSHNQGRNDWIYGFQRQPNTSSLPQKNVYASEFPSHPWRSQNFLRNVTQRRHSPTYITADPMQEVRNFANNPALGRDPGPFFSKAPYNFQPELQPNYSSFSFNSRNHVFKFGGVDLRGSSSMANSARRFIKPRRSILKLSNSELSNIRISAIAKEDDLTSIRAKPSYFSLPPFLENYLHNAGISVTAMPNTSEKDTFLKSASSEDRGKSCEIIDLDKSSTDKKENNDDEVLYLFTVDSTNAIATEIDLTTENGIQKSKIATPVRRNQKRKISNTDSSLAKKLSVDPTAIRIKENAGVAKDSSAKKITAEEPQCSVCNMRYHAVDSSNETMCAARCGHVFCLPCVRKGISECRTCGAKCLIFHRLFL